MKLKYRLFTSYHLMFHVNKLPATCIVQIALFRFLIIFTNISNIYVCLQEYEGLTNKIHELQLREMELQEHLKSDSTDSSQPLADAMMPPQPPAIDSPDAIFQMDLEQAASEHSLQAKGGVQLRNTVKAYLPMKQITSVRET